MPKFTSAALIAAMALGALAAPTAVSAQTVEGANAFLARVAEQGSSRVYRSWHYSWTGRNMAGQDCSYGCPYTSWRPVRLTSATSSASCQTVLGHEPPQGFQEGDFWHTSTAPVTAAAVDW